MKFGFGNPDYEQATCFDHPNMNFSQALATLSQNVAQKWIPAVVDYYQLKSCSADPTANNSRCCEIIRRIFNTFYSKYGPQFENNKLFSYHLNCYPKCPVVHQEGICRHSSELPYVFGTVGDCDSHCTWDEQTRSLSNGIIAHWINTATTGRPLNSWPSYDPSTPKYFHLTPDQGFVAETWNRNCSFFDELEDENMRKRFLKY